jgi:hypothetical protein
MYVFIYLYFSYDPSSGETSVDFEFEFEGTKDVARITTNFDEYLNRFGYEFN